MVDQSWAGSKAGAGAGVEVYHSYITTANFPHLVTQLGQTGPGRGGRCLILTGDGEMAPGGPWWSSVLTQYINTDLDWSS